MVRIVRRHYRYGRPPRKRMKAVALTTGRIVRPVKDIAAEKSSDAPDAEQDLAMLGDRPKAQPLQRSVEHG